ncbi:DUF2953 domain-containing protein [Mesobacillus zeae]|uniref:DUF2953 domain-containing protein n=1 Tax=Mesobacillus zeae TaxID=1917180 RepID=A0A398B1D7_9BACI|nr:DUF2953 domain-containing protein [Mesobacillus zeae]RID83134.1 DUF2953 domain-containing protein [Mesobacillus zeae]
MVYWLIPAAGVLALFLILLLIVMLTKITVSVDYYHGKNDDRLCILIKAWAGMIWRKIEYPVIEVEPDTSAIAVKGRVKGPRKDEKHEGKVDRGDVRDSIHDFKVFVEHIAGLNRLTRFFLRKVAVRKFSWHTVAGIGDAATTAVICGGIWAAKGGLMATIGRYMKLQAKPVLSVTPCFQGTVSQTKLSCIFQVRAGHAILAGTKLIKYWKGGMPEFRSSALSVLSNDKTNTV